MEKSEHIYPTGDRTSLNRRLEELAFRMSNLARKIRDLTIAAFENDTASNTMRDLFEMFKRVLTPDPTATEFADMFAQTLSYGLFAARLNHTGPVYFQDHHANNAIPQTDPLLRQLFATITGPEMNNEPFNCYVDELVRLLAGTNVGEVPTGFNRLAYQEDSLSCFYEKFLEQYHPQLRELRGVYYTPEPVVSYIVRSVDLLLHRYFNDHGQYSGSVILLDPACGTGIFLQAMIAHIRADFRKTDDVQGWLDYVHAHLLPRLFGFELLMAPYVIAHLKLGILLAALDLPETERHIWAYNFDKDERLNIYLTNTLEKVEEVLKYSKLQKADEEAERAGVPLLYAKREETQTECARGTPDGYPASRHYLAPDKPVVVIFGNPPYAGHSANKGQWINTLIETYKEDCPELKKPGQAKWLSDDYVKFMRFAQWHIEQAGYGILAFITNHSYLDNPTFRAMRRSLLNSFDDIYILDLHGNSKKQEQAPDGSKDENVFDIQQGVAISIFVKWRNVSNVEGQVYHANLWGPREVYELDGQRRPVLTDGKYSWLVEHDLGSTQWSLLNPQPPFYLFAPQDNQYLADYKAGWSVPDIFRPNGNPAPGIVTCHDQFAISWSEPEACSKVERFLATETEDMARRLFRLCSQNQWQYTTAKSELRRGMWRQETREILYRPFDRRWTVFNRHVAVHRRVRVMRHMLTEENIGLTIGRAGQVIDQDEWDIAFCTRFITEFNLYRRGGNNLFPLYLYSGTSSGERRVNFAAEFIADCATRLRMIWVPDGRGDRRHTFGPEDVFAYIYAVFYSPSYRKRYAPFLKIDFPCLPLTSKRDLFCMLCTFGDRLVYLHLMEQRLSQITSYPVQGENIVESVQYAHQSERGVTGRVWINATQYFCNVPLEAWNFSIGGYQVCKKWLKDRKGRKLSEDDLDHYQQIVAILMETVHLMREVDRVIDEHGGWPL